MTLYICLHFYLIYLVCMPFGSHPYIFYIFNVLFFVICILLSVNCTTRYSSLVWLYPERTTLAKRHYHHTPQMKYTYLLDQCCHFLVVHSMYAEVTPIDKGTLRLYRTHLHKYYLMRLLEKLCFKKVNLDLKGEARWELICHE